MFDTFDAETMDQIPAGLDEMDPGPFLAAILSSTDVSRLSGRDRVTVLQAQQRMASHFQARVYESMSAVVDVYEDEIGEDPLLAAEGAAAEIRAALRLTRRAADSELGFALHLRERLPAVFQTLSSGVIDVRRAKVIDHGTSHLSVETARKVVDQVIDRAGSLTTGQLGARIRKLCVEADPEEAKQRFEDAVEQRRVYAEANETGTANLLGLDLAPERVTAVTNRINKIALSLKAKTEVRTMDQLRADVFVDLLLGNSHAHGKSHRSRDKGVVHMTSDLQTLAELADNPGELAGYGPVIADINRQVAKAQEDGQWEYAIIDPTTGRVYTGTTKRRPTAGQRRQVEAETPFCIFPGCRMPATQCDIDHNQAWAEGGETVNPNLGPFCRHDHGTKHNFNWQVKQLKPGVYQLTSPLGHTYTTSGLPP
jgi:hypothetical protein